MRLTRSASGSAQVLGRLEMSQGGHRASRGTCGKLRRAGSEGPREVVQCCGVTTNTLDHDACGRWEPHGGNLGSPTTATLTAGGKFSVAMPLNADFHMPRNLTRT